MRTLPFILLLLMVLPLFPACDVGGEKHGNVNNVNNLNNTNNLGCLVGEEASATLGAEGGTLPLCGASVTIDAGALSTPLGLTLRVVETPAGIPHPFEAAGPAFELTVDGAVPVVFPQALSILVPHATTTRHLFFYRHTVTDGWQEVEACTVDATVIGQRMSVGGTFIALADTVDFPSGVEGLGAGTLASSFQGVDRTWDLDSGSIDTYAIYNEDPSGGRAITLSATVIDDQNQVEFLNIKMNTTPQGEGGVLQISYGSTADPDGSWVYLPFEDTASVTIDFMEGEALRGTLTAPLERGGLTETITIDFDVTMELYRYAAELVCETAD